MENPWQSEARSLSAKVLLHAPTRCNLLASLGVSTEYSNSLDTQQVADNAARLPIVHHVAEQLISINSVGIAEMARNRHEFACFAAFLVDSASMLAQKAMQNGNGIEELQHRVTACSIHASQTHQRTDNGPDVRRQCAEMIFGGDVQCVTLAERLRFHSYTAAPDGHTTLRQTYTVQDTYLAHILQRLRTWDPDLSPTTVLPDLQIPPDALNPMENDTTGSEAPVEAPEQPTIASEASLATPSCTDSSETSSIGTVDAVELALRARLRSGWPLRNAADDWWRKEMAIRGW